MIRTCAKHGETEHFIRGTKQGYRCRPCSSEAVVLARKRKKTRLLREIGLACSRCGYDRSIWAMDFHHVDAATKEFAVSARMDWAYDKLLAEARKCVVLCKNCHSEFHNGLW